MESKLGRGLSALITQKGSEVSRALSAQDRQRLEQIESEIKMEKKKAEDIRKNLTMEIIMGNNPDMNELRSIESRIIELELDRKDLLKGVVSLKVEPGPQPQEKTRNDLIEKRRSDIDMRMLDAIIKGENKPYTQGDRTPDSQVMDHEVMPNDPYIMVETGLENPPKDETMVQGTSKKFSSEHDYVESIKSEIHPKVKLNRLIKESSGRWIPTPTSSPTGARTVIAPVRKRIIKKAANQGSGEDITGPMVNDILKRIKELIASDDLGGADRTLEIAIERYGNVEELLYQHGTVMYLKGDLDKASERFRQVIRLNQRSARSINNLGVILRKKKKYEEAIRIINQAIEIDPKYEKAWYNLGCIFMEIDPPLLKEASIFLKRAIEIDPNFDRAREQLRKLNEIVKNS